MMHTLPDTQLVAPCGINCRLCMAYGRKVDPCPGCRIDDPNKKPTCLNCRIKNCEKLVNGSYQYCDECADFPCERITHLDKRYRLKYATSPIENLQMIRKLGIRKFVQLDLNRWTCPQCGSIMTMHRPTCPACGYRWGK